MIGELLTTAQVAARLGLPESTIRYYRHTGKGPQGFRVGGRRVLYDADEVERWLVEQRQAAGDARS